VTIDQRRGLQLRAGTLQLNAPPKPELLTPRGSEFERNTSQRCAAAW